MSNGKKKKRTWILAGVACVIIIALIVAAIVLLSNEKKIKKHNKLPDPQAIALEDVIFGKLSVKHFNATWLSENELIFPDGKKNLVIYNIETGNTTQIFSGADDLGSSAFDYYLSPDRKFLMVLSEYQKYYRNSYIAKYTAIDLATLERIDVSPGFLQLGGWGPHGNSIFYVYRNSLYYMNNAHAEPTLIAEGSEAISQGLADWVYEEEVFSKNKAVWFSPDGKQMAYATFNDTEVPLLALTVYGEPANIHFQYPRAQVFRYPKAGTPNPHVTLNLVDLENLNRQRVLSSPSEIKDQNPILSAVEWASNDTLVAIWMNRVQNESVIVKYKSDEVPKTIKMVKQENGWLDLFKPPIFSKNGSQFVLVMSHDQGGDLGGFRHVTLLTLEEDTKLEELTKGAFVVAEILGWDHKRNLIYYLANTVNDSAVQHLYSVSPDTKKINCLTCDLKNSNNTPCTYNVVEFNTDFSKFTLSCNGPDIPDTTIYTAVDNKKLLTWENNSEMKARLKDKKLPVIKKLTFDLPDNFTAKVMLRLPADMDTSGNTKYPMLVNVYSGPDSALFMDKFIIDWGTYLVSNKGIIYASIDGRGCALRGDKIMHSMYRKFGTVEVWDQINVTKMLQDTLPYVDASRTAIWGWSYGGYASGMALAMDKEGIFKCGVSVAPVTDWTLYDSIYTERFMGLPTPSDNRQGYLNSMLLSRAESLRNKMYYLIHGTYDDNVHFQQSMMLAKVLEQRDIQFRQITYPDEDHSLGLVRPHLYHALENFLDDCFVDKQED